GALAALVVAWTGLWFYGLWSVQTRIAAWTDWEAKAGRSYSCASKAIGGYPFQLELRCAAPQATLLAEQVEGKAAELRAVANVLGSGVVTVELTGPIAITKPGAGYVGNWTLARTDVRGSASRLDEISIVTEGFRLDRMTDRGSERMFDSARAAGDLGIAAKSDSPDTGVVLSLSIAQGSARFDSEPFDAEVNAVLRDIDIATPQRWPALVRQWQRGGGSVAVNNLRIQQRNSVMVGEGTLALNGDGQVTGD